MEKTATSTCSRIERATDGVHDCYLEGRRKLQVNAEKGAVDRPRRGKLLGFSFRSDQRPTIRLAPKTMKRVKERGKEGHCERFEEWIECRLRR
jgi:hypothetical protein